MTNIKTNASNGYQHNNNKTTPSSSTTIATIIHTGNHQHHHHHHLQIWLVKKKHPVWHTKPMQHGTTPHVVPKKKHERRGKLLQNDVRHVSDPPHTIKETASNIQPIVVPLISWDNLWQRNAILNRNGRVM